MKKIVRKTDAQGYFISDVSVDGTLPEFHYDVVSPKGLVKPKINSKKNAWVEGANATELDAYALKHISETKISLREDIKRVSDEKDAKAELIIAGSEVSLRKQNRYRRRVPNALIILDSNASVAEKAKATQKLQMLAMGDNKTVEVYAQDVVNTARLWDDALDIFSALIDTFENRAVALLEENRFDDVQTMLELADTIGVDPNGADLTPEEVLTLASTQVASMLTTFALGGA